MAKRRPVPAQPPASAGSADIEGFIRPPRDLEVSQSIQRGSAVQSLQVRFYGESGPPVVLIHGGPGAPGYVAPVGRRLGAAFRVIEPLQRCSGGEPLTVRRHVEDLRGVMETYCRGVRPALVGHSWGAMLALAFASAYPGEASRLVLVGCGTFDGYSRRLLERNLQERMTPTLAERLRAVSRRTRDADVRLAVTARLVEPLYSCELLPHADETVRYDARGQRETWRDMLSLQRNAIYPAAFVRVREPVLMLHGDLDPHPGERIRDTLALVMPQLEYIALEHCGHYPWWERYARDQFYNSLIAWLLETAA